MSARMALLVSAILHFLAAVHGAFIIFRVWGHQITAFIGDADAVVYLGGTFVANVTLLLAICAIVFGNALITIFVSLEMVHWVFVAATLNYETLAMASLPALLAAYALYRTRRDA